MKILLIFNIQNSQDSMKKLKKILVWLALILVFLISSAMAYVKFALPNVGDAPTFKVDISPQNIERGKYLANHVAICMDCHSTRDWSKFSGPPIESTLGMGGELFDQSFGFPGKYYAANITPEGISRYTDGELFRVITTGVNKEGKAMFPIMPYNYYRKMDEEDIKSIIAYLRTLKPIKNEVPQSYSDFPMNFIINTIPKDASFSKRPEKTDVVNYGSYLANASACIECHSKVDKGAIIEGTEFGGGREFLLSSGAVVRSRNISPDRETGLGAWTDDMFVDLFMSRSDSTVLQKTLKPDAFNSIMPWTMYGKMTKEDLTAIFAYLKTMKPIKNPVEAFTPSARTRVKKS